MSSYEVEVPSRTSYSQPCSTAVNGADGARTTSDPVDISFPPSKRQRFSVGCAAVDIMSTEESRRSRLRRSARVSALAAALAFNDTDDDEVGKSGGEKRRHEHNGDADRSYDDDDGDDGDDDFRQFRPRRRPKRKLDVAPSTSTKVQRTDGVRARTRSRRSTRAALETSTSPAVPAPESCSSYPEMTTSPVPSSPVSAAAPESSGAKDTEDALSDDNKTVSNESRLSDAAALGAEDDDDDDTSAWVNTGMTKEDDDRVVKEVRRRHALAKRLFKAPLSAATSAGPKSRLEQLLDQSSQYTAYMLAQSLAPHDGDYAATPSKRKSNGSTASRRDRRRGRVDLEDEEMYLLQEADAELAGQQGFWTRLEKQPASLTGGTLKPYQLEGLNWLIHLYESGLNGILADEMGLGKTVQTISLLAYLKEQRNIAGPHLILAPKSTLGNWYNEIRKFCPSLNAYKFHGTKEQRAEAKAQGYLTPGRFDIIITSYELCMREYHFFKKFRFRYIVVDEAHRIKNEASKLSRIIRQFRTQFRLLLTGTPLQNNLRELWALLNFLFPEMFASGEEFDRLFDLTGATEEVKSLTAEERTARNADIVARLHKILNPFLLRRVKSEVMVDLPPKKELLLYIPLSSLQRTLYIDLLSRNVDAIHDIQGGGRVRLLNLAMQLRKACNHPYLFEGYEDKSLDPFGEHLVTNSGKVLMLDRLLQRLISRGSRVVVFTQMTRMLDILEDYCRMRGFSYCRLDGSTLGDERERQLEEFNAPGSPHSVFLLSTRAGGLGINLAAADTVILFDSDWNPQVDLQAMDRAHRIGQKKPVNVYRFVHQHTIEEKIIERASLKLKLDTAVIQQGRLSEQQRQLGKGELLRMIQFGADQIFKSKDAAEMTDEDVEAILSRGEQRSQELSSRLESHLKKSLLNFDSSFATPSLYEFEGVDYEPQKDRQAWADMAVRVLEEERNAKRKVRMLQVEALHRQQLGLSESGTTDKLRNKLLKLPRMEEWQFYRRDRINELHDAEMQFMNGLGDEPTFAEREEKQRLLAEGFADWTRKDFLTFVKSCETYGISNIAAIAKEVGKPEREVDRYSAVFLERASELVEGDKWLARVRLGDSVNAKKKEIDDILTKRLCEERFPWRRPFLKFPKSKSHFTDEEDTWLLNAVHALGYGKWEELQLAIARDPMWTFDWFFRSVGRVLWFDGSHVLGRDHHKIWLDGPNFYSTLSASSSTRLKARQRAQAAVLRDRTETHRHVYLYPSSTDMYGTTVIPPAPLPLAPKKSRVVKQPRKPVKAPQAPPQHSGTTRRDEPEISADIPSLAEDSLIKEPQTADATTTTTPLIHAASLVVESSPARASSLGEVSPP